MRYRCFVPVLFVLLLTACTKEINTENPVDPALPVVLKNEAYGSGTRQVADVYLPGGRNSNTPVLLMVHGGGWSDGNKQDLDAIIELLRAQWPQAAIVNINYRLANNTPENYHPAQMNDIAAALSFIASKRTQWNIGEKTAIAGVSAGAHLAMLYAYAFQPANMLKAVVNVVGPADFSDPQYVNSPLFQVVAVNLLGKSWSQDAALHRSVSPALRVTATAPPTFMAYGRLDPVVPLSNAVTLRNALSAAGVAHTYVEYPNEAHEFSAAAITDLAPRVITFLKQYL